jgi:prepilin-type processing-associated H-X9-DG protein
MNAISPWPSSLRQFKKQTDIIRPVDTWVVLDESPGTINDGWFVCEPGTQWVDCPASYHNNAGGISFADGHAQIKKWTDSTVLKYGKLGATPGNFFPQGTPAGDLAWLANLTTYR